MEPLAHPHRPSLESEQRQVRNLVLEMGEMVDVAIDRATRALLDRDVDMATAVITDDAKVNARQA